MLKFFYVIKPSAGVWFLILLLLFICNCLAAPGNESIIRDDSKRCNEAVVVPRGLPLHITSLQNPTMLPRIATLFAYNEANIVPVGVKFLPVAKKIKLMTGYEPFILIAPLPSKGRAHIATIAHSVKEMQNSVDWGKMILNEPLQRLLFSIDSDSSANLMLLWNAIDRDMRKSKDRVIRKYTLKHLREYRSYKGSVCVPDLPLSFCCELLLKCSVSDVYALLYTIFYFGLCTSFFERCLLKSFFLVFSRQIQYFYYHGRVQFII